MPMVFKVSFNTFWDKDKPEAVTRKGADESHTVAARNVEDAIAKVRKKQIGSRVEKQDDNGVEIPGKYYHVTSIVIVEVEAVSELDIA